MRFIYSIHRKIKCKIGILCRKNNIGKKFECKVDGMVRIK